MNSRFFLLVAGLEVSLAGVPATHGSARKCGGAAVAGRGMGEMYMYLSVISSFNLFS